MNYLNINQPLLLTWQNLYYELIKKRCLYFRLEAYMTQHDSQGTSKNLHRIVDTITIYTQTVIVLSFGDFLVHARKKNLSHRDSL